MLSLQIRYQLVTGTTEFIDTTGHVHAGINYAFAAFAKASWALGHGRIRPLLSLALGATRGNQLRAARLLGLNRNTLRKKIKDLDVPVVRTPQVRRGG